MNKSFFVGIVVVVVIAFAGVSYQKFLKSPRCAYDGSPVPPIYEVEAALKDRSAKKFCSIYCAAQWLKKNSHIVDHVVVTDEMRGGKMDSYMAYFVESELITNKSNNNRIHVFQQRQDALTHAEKFHGAIADDPFTLDE